MNSDEIVTFAKLYTMDYEITDLYAEKQSWCDNVVFKRDRPRKSNGLIFLNGCTGEYTDCYGKSFFADVGDLVCLPHKSIYSVRNISSRIAFPDAYLVEFNIVQNGRKLTFADTPFFVRSMNPYYVKELTKSATTEYESLAKSPAMLRAIVYKLIAYLGKESISAGSEYPLLTPAIEFLEKYPISSISVEDLAAMCHISSGCFRKAFRAYAGKSPVQYRIDIKMDMAKKMLENSDTSVTRIAELLGFESNAYFCKLFKKKNGITPSEYRNDN